jgi:hypothetical protein
MKYLRCRNSILIPYRDWPDSKDVLDVLANLCQIRPMKALVVNTLGSGFDFEDVDIAAPVGRELSKETGL